MRMGVRRCYGRVLYGKCIMNNKRGRGRVWRRCGKGVACKRVCINRVGRCMCEEGERKVNTTLMELNYAAMLFGTKGTMYSLTLLPSPPSKWGNFTSQFKLVIVPPNIFSSLFINFDCAVI